jgi:hypothetical protein
MFKSNKYLGLLLLSFTIAALLTACGGDATPAPANSAVVVSVPSVGATPTITAAATTVALTTVAATTSAPTTAAATTSAATTAAAQTSTTSSSIERYTVNFATYREPASTIKQPAFPNYTVAANLSNVSNLKDFKLSDAQKKLLAQNYFVVSPSEYKQFFQAYESFRYDQIPTYVTTDSVAHVYHLLFDKLLRETEKGYLIKDVQALSKALYEASVKQYTALTGSDLQAAALRNVAYTAVAYKLADPKNAPAAPAYATSLVNAELKLIDAAGGIAKSPIMGSDYEEDYSQYIPRGHYTRSDELKNYFRAMMWYGRMTFRAKSDSETQSALLLMQAILTGQTNGQKASDLWKLIYEPTAFFVGTSDDLTYLDYAGLVKTVWGDTGLTDPKGFSDKTKLAAFQKGVDTLPPPKINSMITDIRQDLTTQIKGLRMMGQRFTIDAAIFQNLVWRNVGTLEKPRDLPKGLDIFAALGSEQAAKLLKQQGETQYANYQTQFDKVKSQLATIQPATWTQNLYWSWIYNLQPLTEKRGAGYPAYMQNEAWQNKQLVAGLGSWTELKHDTLLYAKQVYAERGGGPEDLPTGFVEPEPTFYSRMYALTVMTREGLQQRNMLAKEYADILKSLETDVGKLQNIAQKELSGQKISDDERDFIAYWGASIETFTLAATDVDEEQGGNKYLDKQDAALVADVATGLQEVLEEGTGRVNLIYVAVLINGKVTLTQGAAYSQYEFKVKPGDRMTDETWQKQLDAGKAPALEDWKKSYMAAGLPK